MTRPSFSLLALSSSKTRRMPPSPKHLRQQYPDPSFVGSNASVQTYYEISDALRSLNHSILTQATNLPSKSIRDLIHLSISLKSRNSLTKTSRTVSYQNQIHHGAFQLF